MKPRFRALMRRPGGQVLVAVLLFFMVFTVLFAVLYRSGIAYSMKTRAVRGADLTALSCGVLYAEGLNLVRISNVLLLGAAAFDLARMAVVYASTGGPASGPAAVAAALASDPKMRKKVQNAQSTFFGVASPDRPEPIGIYPVLIHAGGFALASDNRLDVLPPLLPLFLFNPETSSPAQTALPGMALRFRTADELLPDTEGHDESEPCYRLRDSRDGAWRYFRPEQLEPAPGAHPNQMRVRCDLPSPYRCKYVQTCADPVAGGGIPGLRWALKGLKGLLRDIRLDVTHRDEPHRHTVLVLSRLAARAHDGEPIGHNAETRVVGGGLAAWDLLEPPFRARLTAIDPRQLPLLRDIAEKIPPGVRRTLERALSPRSRVSP